MSEIEVPQVDDLVAPELGAHRLGHAEAVDVEDAAAHAELRDVLHHRHALESDALEVRRELLGAAHVALAKLDAQIVQRARHARFLEERARGREQDAQLAAADPLERLDALAGDLRVRLGLAESFARRIERDGASVEQRLQVGEPALRLGDAVGGDDEETRRQPARERGDERRVGRSGQAAGFEPRARRGQRVEHARERRQTLDRVEQRSSDMVTRPGGCGLRSRSPR